MGQEYTRLICSNRKVRHDYHIVDTYEAGLVLQGTEVKSLRAGKASLKGSYAAFVGEELYLIDMHIPPYDFGNIQNHSPRRRRKVLLHRRELKKLLSRVVEKGLTLVPTRLYFKGDLAKVELALAQGKRQYDKRQTLKKEEHKRETARILKQRYR